MNSSASPIAGFLEHLKVERRMSANTLDGYARDLHALAQWMEGAGIASLPALGSEDVRGFIAAEHRRGLSPTSLQRRLSALRSLFKHLEIGRAHV